jgi:Fucose permease
MSHSETFFQSSQTPYEDIGSLKATKSVSFDLRDDHVELSGFPPLENRRSGEDEIRPSYSSASSVLTADAIADPLSFQIVCLVVFLGDMARGIFFPTMWNLVKTLGGDQVLLGYTIASFSFGRMLVLPLFGAWSVKYGYRPTLLVSTTILCFGTLLFGNVLNVGTHWFLLVANTIVGIGSGTLGVTIAYASDVTPTRNRTSYMAWVGAVQYAGTSATPFLGSLFVVMFSRREEEGGENRGCVHR